MTDRFLVAYATAHGSTAEVAQAIADTLAAGGEAVDCRPAAAVEAVDDYQAVILGSPIHSGAWLPEAVDFVGRHPQALCRVPVALFVVGLLGDHTDGTRQAKLLAVESERILLGPVDIAVFNGRMDYGRLSAIQRLQIQTKGLPEGDFRDWETIRDWAADLREVLTRATPG